MMKMMLREFQILPRPTIYAPKLGQGLNIWGNIGNIKS